MWTLSPPFSFVPRGLGLGWPIGDEKGDQAIHFYDSPLDMVMPPWRLRNTALMGRRLASLSEGSAILRNVGFLFYAVFRCL